MKEKWSEVNCYPHFLRRALTDQLHDAKDEIYFACQEKLPFHPLMHINRSILWQHISEKLANDSEVHIDAL